MEQKLDDIRKTIFEFKDVNEEIERLNQIKNDTLELQTKFLQKLESGYNSKYNDRSLKIFDLKGSKKKKEILERLKDKYPNDEKMIEYLQSLEDRITHGAKLMSVFSEAIKQSEKIIKENQNKLAKINEERNRFVDSIINEYNEKTAELRHDVAILKKRKIEDVHMNATIPAIKKSNNDHIHAESSNTLLSGQSLFTSISYLPEDVGDPYWNNGITIQTNGLSNNMRGHGHGHGRGRGRGRGRSRGRGKGDRSISQEGRKASGKRKKE